MNKPVLFSVAFLGIVAGLVVTYELTQPVNASVEPVRSKSADKYEAQLTKFLKKSSPYIRSAQDWVEVKDCKITQRLYRNANCTAFDNTHYSEYRIDLTEIKEVAYFEQRVPSTTFKGAITFKFRPDVQSRLDTSRDMLLAASEEKKGLTNALRHEHMTAAEQRLIRKMHLGDLGSYEITEDCSGKKRVRHVPFAINNINLSDLDRRATDALVRYHAICAGQDPAS